MYHLPTSPITVHPEVLRGSTVIPLAGRGFALSVILLCGATSQPAYLDGTQLLPAFRMTFALYQEKEIRPPDPNKKNEVVYFTDGSTTYMKSIFRESPLLPGEPFSFKDQEVEWYVVRDPGHQNQYMARVYCRTCSPKS
jgi:hypothetical protein